MDRIIVEGGRRLKGDVQISGSKNSTLALMAAALLTDEEVVLRNVPRVRDVDGMLAIFEALGAKAGWDAEDPHAVRINARSINRYEAPYDLVRKMRASFMVLGPLVTRFGQARVSEPGGCAIGVRPIDQHLKGIEALGAKSRLDHGYAVQTQVKFVWVFFLDVGRNGAVCRRGQRATRASFYFDAVRNVGICRENRFILDENACRLWAISLHGNDRGRQY